METDFQSLQDENHQLREYILNLQSQLLGQNKESSSSAQPMSPHRKRVATRDDAEPTPQHEMPSEGAPTPGSAAPPPPGMASGGPRGVVNSHRAAPASGESWSEHIDNLRQRYGDYPAHRPSAEGEPSNTAEGK